MPSPSSPNPAAGAAAFLVLIGACELALARLTFDAQLPSDAVLGLLGLVLIGGVPWGASRWVDDEARRPVYGSVMLAAVLGVVAGRVAASGAPPLPRVGLQLGWLVGTVVVGGILVSRRREPVPPPWLVPAVVGPAAALALWRSAGRQAQEVVNGGTRVGVDAEPLGALVLLGLAGWWLGATLLCRGAVGAALTAVVSAALAVVPRPLPEPVWQVAGPVPDGPDVVLITVDTLRADVAAEMDVYRRLAADGTRFEAAWSTAPWTLPSMASLHTGLDPTDHGAFRQPTGAFSSVDPSVPTLAERLSEVGYDTAAVVAPNAFVGRGFGLHRGFASWEHILERSSRAVPLSSGDNVARPLVADLLVGLGVLGRRPFGGADELGEMAAAVHRARRDRPLLLWVHLLDPHLPYRHVFETDLPRATKALFGGGDPLAAFPEGAFTEAEARAAYRHEVGHVDRALGALLDALGPPGPRGRVVVLTADHGEELMDHGGFEHGHSLYEELLNVPLVMNGLPGLAPGRVTAPVSLRDLHAALLRAAGAHGADGATGGLAAPSADRPLRAWNLLYGDPFAQAARQGPWKAVDLRDGPPRLVHLGDDPAEAHDLAPRHPARLDALLSPIEVDDGDVVELSPSERRMLETLGYLDPE